MTTRTVAGWLACLCLCGWAGAAVTRPGPEPAGEPPVRRLDRQQAADLDERIEKLHARLAPAVVRILNPRRPGGFSGVIVSPAGEILTCAHHNLPPDTRVVVRLADGREVRGTIRGSVKQKAGAAARYPAADVGMVLLDDKGDWPAAALGGPDDGKAGGLCLALGQPNVRQPGQPPLLRLGRILSPHPLGKIRTTCRALPGDSGGPLFDLEGRVLGVHVAMEALGEAVTLHSPVADYLRFRDRLRAGEVVTFEKEMPEPFGRRQVPWGAWAPTDELTKTLNGAHTSTVEILGDGKAVALGLIVGADGWVLTKRTVLTGPAGPRRLVCRLADGTPTEARVAGESRAHDLALLKVAAAGLPAVRWGPAGGPRVGQLVASLGPEPRPLHFGVVGALRVQNPGVWGDLPFRVEPAPEGVAFAEFLPRRPEVEEARALLKAGDLLTHLDGVPTPTAEVFARVRDRLTNAPGAFAGEAITLSVRRGGKATRVILPLIEKETPIPAVWQAAHWNVRRSGFPDVFSHDGGIAHDRCGGPVVDRSGRVLGVNIARADAMQTYAIPAEVARRVLAELLASAAK